MNIRKEWTPNALVKQDAPRFAKIDGLIYKYFPSIMKIRPLAAFTCLKIKSHQMPTRDIFQLFVGNSDWSDYLISYYEIHAEAL